MTATPPPPPPSRPLAGVRVLDLTTFLSGPFATQILADLGADVIKVEAPDGDMSRAIPPHFLGEDSVYFLATNRGKRSITLDLKSPDGHRVAQRLIERCDVVIENFRPGVAKRLGLDPEDLHAGRPSLVWASISGFGQYGTMRDQPAYDMVVQALSGVMSLTGEDGRPAVRLGIPAGDLVAGMYAVIGIVAALLARRTSGRGQVIDVAMLDCQLAMLSYQGAYALVAGATPGPQGRGHDSIATYRSFQGADGREFVVTANTERMWQALCEAVGQPELVADERFADAGLRLANREPLWQLLEAEFARRPAGAWVTELTGRGVPAALIKTVPEALEDAAAAGRDMVLELDGPGGGRTRLLGNPIKFAGGDPGPDRFPPSLGQDTTSILRDLLELPPDEIADLHAKGAVGGGRRKEPR